MKPTNKPKMVPVTNEAPFKRIDVIKSVILERRRLARYCASYELYGILIDNEANDVKAERIEHAPTAADFAPMTIKKRIAGYLNIYDMVVEFRGAWKSDAEAKVVAYELETA